MVKRLLYIALKASTVKPLRIHVRKLEWKYSQSLQNQLVLQSQPFLRLQLLMRADTLGAARLFALAVATSIDAMAVGVSFAFSPPSPGLWLSCAVIGCTTFLLTLAAAFLGSRFSNLHPRKAGIAGGTVLIAIGLKILLEGIL